MENEPSSISLLFEKAVDYLETRIELFKLEAVNMLSEILSSMFSSLIIIVFFAFFIFMLNIGVALWIGDILGKTYYGFFIVAGFYIVVGFIFYLARNKWLKRPVSNLIIKKMLN
jgi:hypothetical protein